MPLVGLRNDLRRRYRMIRERMADPFRIPDLPYQVRRLFLQGQENIGSATKDFLASLDAAKLEFAKTVDHDLALLTSR